MARWYPPHPRPGRLVEWSLVFLPRRAAGAPSAHAE